MFSESTQANGRAAYGRTGLTASSRTPVPVVLHSTDLDASRKFYFDLLGFVPAEGYGYSDNRLVLVSPLLAQGYRSIVLTRDPRGATSHGLRLDLETSSELLDRYLLARLLGAPTTPLMSRGRTLTVSITDPDGNEVELRSTRPVRHDDADDAGRRWGRATAADCTSPTGHGRGRSAAGDSDEGPDRQVPWFDSLCDPRDLR